MKVGLRIPNINKKVKARTTAKIKRKVKKAINPLYGKKGMGYITNPKNAVYNKIYNKTSFSLKTTGNVFLDLIILPIKLIYYLYKWLFLGVIWLCKKIYNYVKKGKNEQMV